MNDLQISFSFFTVNLSLLASIFELQVCMKYKHNIEKFSLKLVCTDIITNQFLIVITHVTLTVINPGLRYQKCILRSK